MAQQTLLDNSDLTAEALRNNWYWFAANFAVNHGVVTTPIVLASSVLAGDGGYVGTATLNIFTMIGSFFLGAPVTSHLGMRGGVLFGMLNYCLFAGLFTVAAFLGRSGHLSDKEVLVQTIVFAVGSALGGTAAGVLWTAQGAYFNKTVDLMLERADRGTARESITAKLAGRFATMYLIFEVLAKLLWALLDHLKITIWIIALIFTGFGVTALVLQFGALQLHGTPSSAPLCKKVQVAASLWSDPVLWLVSGINLTFGFSAAFMNGYINANYTKDQLPSYAVTMLAGLTALFAGVFSSVFAKVSLWSGKGVVVVLGCLSFLGIPFCFFGLGCCDNWGWALVTLYILQGSGRAVYESTNKGIFADLFKTNAPGAFANQILQVTGSSAVCFFLSSILKGPTLAWIAMVLALVTPFGYFGAVVIRRRQAAREEQAQTALAETAH